MTVGFLHELAVQHDELITATGLESSWSNGFIWSSDSRDGNRFHTGAVPRQPAKPLPVRELRPKWRIFIRIDRALLPEAAPWNGAFMLAIPVIKLLNYLWTRSTRFISLLLDSFETSSVQRFIERDLD
jgi:hypothetical protein